MSLKYLAVLALVIAAPAAAIPGLTVTTWNNIPELDYYPSSATIDQQMAHAAANTPSSTSVIGYNPYGFSFQQNGYTSQRLTGTLNVATAGNYYFEIAADDAARLMIDGVALIESNFYGGNLNLPFYTTLNLTAGAHSFDLFAFQNVGGTYLYSMIDGAAGLSFDSVSPNAVPEPAMLGLFGLGALGLGLARRRRK